VELFTGLIHNSNGEVVKDAAIGQVFVVTTADAGGFMSLVCP
jgi:hypothetical protein